MKPTLFAIIAMLFLVSSSNAQKLSEKEIQEIYTLGLKEFLQKQIIKHKKDKKQVIVMTNENIREPNRINKIKVAWITNGMEPTDVMRGKNEKHNGRSIITISHKIDEDGAVRLSIYQWHIKDAEKKKLCINSYFN
jgi:hypothetical protein